MKNKINFITGETYTLSELYSGERRIIIPDLQRDYCWGSKVHTKNQIELVSGFTTNLIDLFESKQRGALNLGLIYGYESPENHIQLCDGQQRITTLFLLVGMLNKKTRDNRFRRQLISDYEYHKDDKEPYLQYAIRESSLYFLSDLVCHFFIQEEDDKDRVTRVKDIKSAQWFFNDYNEDASIVSMLDALETIEAILDGKRNDDPDWYEAFGEFLTTKLTFMYYDMGNRRNGEETFVMINTTGEPLTATQNLKPLVMNAVLNREYSGEDAGHPVTLAEDWENIENWFWINKSANDDTAEAGFDEFLRWVTMLDAKEEPLKIILKQKRAEFPYSEIPFKKIYKCWEVVKVLFGDRIQDRENGEYPWRDSLFPKDSRKAIEQIDAFQLLPMMAYCIKWNVTDPGDRNLLRWYHFLRNLTRKDDVSKSVNTLVYGAIRMAETYGDVLELVDNKENIEISKTILTEEEIRKLEILKENIDPDKRKSIEEAFWEAQSSDKIKSHQIWSGQIGPLIGWASDESGEFHLGKFREYLEIFDTIFKGDYKAIIDPVRRALLTRSLINYPSIQGNQIHFGWTWDEWHQLIWDNSEAFKMFFDDCMESKADLNAYLESLCAKYPKEKEWAEFVYHPFLLEYCDTKHIIRNEDENLLLVRSIRSKPFLLENALLLCYLMDDDKWENNNNGKLYHNEYPDWEVWRYTGYDGNCVVVENTQKDIVMDVDCTISGCTIGLFRRNASAEDLGDYGEIRSTPEWYWDVDAQRWIKEINGKPDNEKIRLAVEEVIHKVEEM